VDGDNAVSVYNLGSAELRISTPLTVEDIHNKAVNSIYLSTYQDQIQEVNTKLELLGEDKVVLEINTEPTFCTVEEQKSLIIKSLEKSIEDIKTQHTYLNDMLPSNYNGYDLTYTNGKVILTVDTLATFTSLPLQIEGIDLFYAYDEYSSLSYSDLSQKYGKYLAKIEQEKAKEVESKKIENFVDYPKVDFTKSVNHLIDSFSREYNSLLECYVYQYIVKEGNTYYWKKTMYECTADTNKELFKSMITRSYESQEFQYSIEEMLDYIESNSYSGHLTNKQEILCEQLDSILESANGSYSVQHYHNKAIKVYQQILNDSKIEIESDLALKLRMAMSN
jgi:hypothetical protein